MVLPWILGQMQRQGLGYPFSGYPFGRLKRFTEIISLPLLSEEWRNKNASLKRKRENGMPNNKKTLTAINGSHTASWKDGLPASQRTGHSSGGYRLGSGLEKVYLGRSGKVTCSDHQWWKSRDFRLKVLQEDFKFSKEHWIGRKVMLGNLMLKHRLKQEIIQICAGNLGWISRTTIGKKRGVMLCPRRPTFFSHLCAVLSYR